MEEYLNNRSFLSPEQVLLSGLVCVTVCVYVFVVCVCVCGVCVCVVCGVCCSCVPESVMYRDAVLCSVKK